MEVWYRCCAGLDVHAKTVVACLMKGSAKTTRTFSTITDELLALSDWLLEQGCTHVAIESTGVYWRPVFNLLEGLLEVILVNARHIKAVPGRKTDVKDSEWLADLLRHGLLKASFIPPLEIRELRELTRYRQTLIGDQAAIANRIQRLIESGNVKLGQVASDCLGVSGRLMLRRLAEGEDNAQTLASLARGQLKKKEAELRRALSGRMTVAQRFVLGELLDRYEEQEKAIARVNEEIKREVENSPDPFVAKAVELLETIPGVGRQEAEAVVSEMGVKMEKFPSERHLASWVGLCPGNEESAGKRKSGKTTKGNQSLRTALVQAAWAATHTKKTYLSAQYYRLVKRKGRKKALVAVAHSILIIMYHIIERQEKYQELGGDYFEKQKSEDHCRRLVRQLEALGMKVTVEAHRPAA
jgi:transposase